MWWGWDGGWGWSSLHMLIGAAFWILFALGMAFVIRRMSGGDLRSGGETALEILKKRYARGEIEGEEFQRRKRELAD